MAKSKDKIRFKLTGKEKSCLSFELSMKRLQLPKGKGEDAVLKNVEYVPGHDSIFTEDHKGDQKSESIWFVDGTLDVHVHNKSLLEIMRRHPWNGKKYEEVSEQKEATKNLTKYKTIRKAMERVSIANEDERKATAIVLLGQGYLTKLPDTIEAALMKEANESPESVLGKLNSADYTGKLAAALALTKGVVEMNATRTSILWSDTKKPILNVGMGQDAYEKFGQYLTGTTDDVKITLQEIGEKIKRDYTPKAKLDMQRIFQIENGEVDIDPKANMTIEQAREKYKEVFGEEVPVNVKNNLEWMTKKIAEELEPA